MYHYHQDHLDLKYFGLDLSEMKKKDNGKIAKYSHITKFYDEIKWGAGIAGQHLSTHFIRKWTLTCPASKRNGHQRSRR